MKLLLVEDHYGVEFHATLLRKLRGSSASGIRIRRVPAKECNVAMVRKIKAMLFPEVASSKIVIVVDSEGAPPTEVARRIYTHFKRSRGIDMDRVRVAVVTPRHESWLCIGLGLNREACRSHPEDLIVRSHNLKSYEKRYLAKLAREIDVAKLMSEQDFREYIDAIEWLCRDP